MKALPIIIAVFISLNSWSPDVAASPFAVINEVLYDGFGTDADEAFTELFGTPGLVLDGWSLTGTNGADGAVYRTVDLSGGIIPVDGVFLIATLDTVLAGVDLFANVDWQNGPDSIQLLDSGATIVDALQYGDAGGFNAGEGLPAADAGAGQSLSRDFYGTDTDNNYADFLTLDTPTPGTGPRITTVPEPGSLVLMASGLFCLLLLSRSRMHIRQVACSKNL